MLQYHCMSSHQKKQTHFRSKDVCMSITDLLNENMLIVLVIETEKQGSHTEEWNGGQPEEVIHVGLTPTGVQRPETRSLAARLIPRPDRGRQPTHGCGPPSRCAY
jgi:hypothetical protein